MADRVGETQAETGFDDRLMAQADAEREPVRARLLNGECLPQGPVIPSSWAPSERTTPSATGVMWSRSIPFVTTASGISLCSRLHGATYRNIVERRAQENRVDFIEGVATALLPVTFFEVVMNKAFRTLVDDGTEVSVETGLRAAEKLQSVLDGRERGTDILELKVQLGRIGEAVRAVVPQQMWAAIVEQLEELEQHSGAFDAGEDGFDDADDDPYDPMEFIDEDDEF